MQPVTRRQRDRQVMTASKWIISRVGLKNGMVLAAMVYFFFMFIFHSNIQLTKRENFSTGEGSSEFENETFNFPERNEERSATFDETFSFTERDTGFVDVHFSEILELAKQSPSTYLNVQPRCLRDTASANGLDKTTFREHSAVKETHPSVTNDQLPVSEEAQHKLLKSSGNESSEELRLRRRNAELPFSAASFVFNEEDFKFQEFSRSSAVFSAYLDDRPNDYDNRHNGSHVRLMSILRAKFPPLYCVFNAEHESRTMYSSKVTGHYEMCENHKKQFGGFILSCHVPMEITAPCFVTLYNEDPESERFDITRTTGIRVPIRTTTRNFLKSGNASQAPRWNITACVSPLFGEIQPSRLVEFVEFTLASGVDRITFYPFRIRPDIIKILKYYVLERKVADVVPWGLDSSYVDRIWYNGQLVAVQDCMYRSMALSSYVAFLDIDELFVPRKHKTLRPMIQEMDSEKKCGFQFPGTYFPPFLNQKKQSDEVLGSLVIPNSLYRTKNFDRVRTKCIVKPQQIFESGIHHISKPIWSFLESFPVDPKHGVLHHYKSPSRSLYKFNSEGRVFDKDAYKFAFTAVKRTMSTLGKLTKL